MIKSVMSFHYNTRICFGDCDPACKLFYGNVFHLAHRALEEYIVDRGIPWKEWFASEEWGVPVRHSEADFLAPMGAGDNVTIEVSLISAKETSCSFSFIFIRDCDGTRAATVITTHVFVDKQTLTGRKIPASILEKLN